MIGLSLPPLREVVALGAHCDDLAIGAGGTLLTLAEGHPGLKVHALILTGGGGDREREERSALASFLPGVSVDVSVLSLPDGRLPECWGSVKTELQRLAAASSPDLVLAPQRDDAHQDHRLLAQLAPTVFRDQLTLGYEILKWESDMPRSTLYQPISVQFAALKCDLLIRHYASQAMHDWFDRESFLGLLRLRGAQCRSRYAEAYVVEKMVLGC